MNRKLDSIDKAIKVLTENAVTRAAPDYQRGYWNGFHGEPSCEITANYLRGYSDGKADAIIEDIFARNG